MSTPGGIHTIPGRGGGAGSATSRRGPPSTAASGAASGVASLREHARANSARSAPESAPGTIARPAPLRARPMRSVRFPFAQAQLLHLELQALARDLEEPRRVGDVALRLMERAHDELALQPAHRRLDLLLEAIGAGHAATGAGSGAGG